MCRFTWLLASWAAVPRAVEVGRTLAAPDIDARPHVTDGRDRMITKGSTCQSCRRLGLEAKEQPEGQIVEYVLDYSAKCGYNDRTVDATKETRSWTDNCAS